MRHTRASTLKHLDTSVYSPYGESLNDQFSVCLRMSNHYRRVYTSKNVVDTSPPRLFGLHHGARRKGSRNLSPGDTSQSLVDAIIYDTQNAPSTYRCFYSGTGSGPKNRPTKPKPSFQLLTSRTLQKARQPHDILERHIRYFVVPQKTFQPRILKSEAVSKVRAFRTYHPPRSKGVMTSRKVVSVVEGQGDCSQDEWQLEDVADLVQASDATVRSDSAQSSAKSLSCDSAYSGGASSGRESCGLPPDQRQDDIRYTKFIHEVTEDVLRRGVFTNSGLRLLFQRHIRDNEQVLVKARMEKELQKLSDELGICDEAMSGPCSSNVQIPDGRTHCFTCGNEQCVEDHHKRSKVYKEGVTVKDEHLYVEKYLDSRTCPPLTADPEKCLCENECVCECSSSTVPSQETVLRGVELEASNCGRCYCKQGSQMQRFWTSISNWKSMLPASDTTNDCPRDTLSRDSMTLIASPHKITNFDKHLEV